MATTFNSTLDDKLMETLRKAGDVAGVKKATVRGKTPKTYVYEDGYLPFLGVFPVTRFDQNIPVRVFKDTDWPEEMRQFIPNPDEHYVFDPEATLSVVSALMHGDRATLIHGPKGSGKTTLPQQICARIRMPYVRVNSREDMESSAIFGSVKYDPTNGMSWVDGPLAEFAKNGGVFCDDEVSRTPSGINASLMAALEQGSDIYLSDKPGTSAEKRIVPHEWFRIVCTDNTELQGDTTGKYVGTNVQDEALIDRFTTTIRLGYLNPAHEVAILTGKVKDIDNITAQKMVQMAAMIRDAYDQGAVGFTMSPRGLIEWAKKIERWDSIKQGFKLSFFNKLTPTDGHVVAEFYHTVFSENLTR